MCRSMETKLNRFWLETNKPFSLGNGQLGLQYPHCFWFPTWWCLLVTMVEHQGTSSVELLLMQWLYLIPLYLTGKTHFLPMLPPPVVTQSSEAWIKRVLLFCIFQMWKKYNTFHVYFDTLFRYPHSYYLPLFGLDNMHTTVKIKINLTRHNTMVCCF